MYAQIQRSMAASDFTAVESQIRRQHDHLLRSMNPKRLPPGVNSIEEMKEQ